MIGKKRLALVAGSVTAAGAVATLVAGTTFGLFSATPSSSTANTFATGTVSIGNPVSTACTITDMVPGDESTGFVAYSGDGVTGNNQSSKDLQCKFQVQYTGSVPAYIGLGTAASGNLPLKWELASATSDNNTPTTPTQAPGSTYTSTAAGSINANSASSPLYVAKDAGTANSATGDKYYTFYVDYALATAYSAQTNTGASLTLTVYAVQAGNNGDGSSCVVGSSCGTGSTGIGAWS